MKGQTIDNEELKKLDEVVGDDDGMTMTLIMMIRLTMRVPFPVGVLM